MKAMGLNGIEAYYPAHTDPEAHKYEDIARRHDLLVTSGSDYHGAMRMHSAIASERRTSVYLKASIQKIIMKYL
jgi:predicted metal-dependent phosphoesterase TrpH